MKPPNNLNTAGARYILLAVAVFLLLGVLLGAALVLSPDDRAVETAVVPLCFEEYERRARSRFYRCHPGEKPLNWAVADAARRMTESRPMGPFSLHENDCSDFVNCVVDEGLGYRPRFQRDGDHIGSRLAQLWYSFKWDGTEPLLPGDIVSVRHSPWYPPNPDACSHLGVIGPGGRVHDWAKLVSWDEPRYHCVELSTFVRNCTIPGHVRVRRLHPKYRYGVAPLPAGLLCSN